MASNDVSLFSVIEDTASAHGKAPNALRTISEASDLLDIPQHVLRFWETKFVQIKPLKRNGGRRFYRPQDLDVLQQIKHLLYAQGYTIKGAQKAIADYVASRASAKHEVVLPLQPVFPAAHVNDNLPVASVVEVEDDVCAEPPVDDLLAELAQALAEPEEFAFAATSSGVAGVDRAALLELRENLIEARDALAHRLAA